MSLWRYLGQSVGRRAPASYGGGYFSSPTSPPFEMGGAMRVFDIPNRQHSVDTFGGGDSSTAIDRPLLASTSGFEPPGAGKTRGREYASECNSAVTATAAATAHASSVAHAPSSPPLHYSVPREIPSESTRMSYRTTQHSMRPTASSRGNSPSFSPPRRSGTDLPLSDLCSPIR